MLGVSREFERDLRPVSRRVESVELKDAGSEAGGSTRTVNGIRPARLTSRAVLGGVVGRRRGGDALESTFLSELPTRGLEDFSTR